MTLQRFVERLIWLCMLPLALLSIALVCSHVVTLEQRRDLLAQSVASTAARSVNQLLEVHLASLQLLARTIEDQALRRDGSLDLQRAWDLAMRFTEVHETHIVIGHRSGTMLLNTRVPLGSSLPDLPQPQGRSAVTIVLRDGIPAVGDPVFGQVAQTVVIPLGVPIHSEGYPEWVVVGLPEALTVKARLTDYVLPPKWSLTVFDSGGQTIASIGAERPPAAQPMFLTTSRTMAQRESRTERLGLAPWTIHLYAPAPSFWSDPLVQGIILIVALSAAMAAAYWAGRLTSRRLVRSMASLVEEVEDPDPDVDIDEVAQVRRRLQRLDLQRQEAQEVERRRIGLELHDDLQQKLAVLRFDLAKLAEMDHEAMRHLPQEAIRALALVDETLESTRRMVRDLRPLRLEEAGLVATLDQLARQTQRAHGLVVDLRVSPEGDDGQLPIEVASALYRIAQETLNNVVKHAHAHHVELMLDLSNLTRVVLEVVDDGQGFEPLTVEASCNNGLDGMRERAYRLGGYLQVHSRPGEGTAVLVSLPLAPGSTRSGPSGA